MEDAESDANRPSSSSPPPALCQRCPGQKSWGYWRALRLATASFRAPAFSQTSATLGS